MARPLRGRACFRRRRSATSRGAPGTPSASADWSWVYGENDTVNLDNSYAGLNPAASGANAPASQSQWMVLTGPQYTSFFQIQSAAESNPNLYALSIKSTQVTLASGTVLAGDTALTLTEVLYEFVQETRVTTAYVQSQLLTGANLPITTWAQSTTYPLATAMLAPVSGTSLSLQGLQPLGVNAPVAISGSRLRIVATSNLASPSGGFTPTGATGMLNVSANQPFLVDAFPPPTDPTTGNLLWSVLTVTGQAGILSTPTTGFQLQPSASSDPTTGEAAVISDAEVEGATTALSLNAALTRIYDASTVTVNANAVEATHGETMQEILGSGSATNASLEFQLKQSPLTYISAANTETECNRRCRCG